VTIFHNVAQSKHGQQVNLEGYAEGAPLVRVFEYDRSGHDSAEQFAEDAFYLFNVDPGYMQPGDYEIACSYRDRRLRSLSTGDVVVVGDDAIALEPIGFRRIDASQLKEVHEEHYGTVPLQPPH
jgi:hypothetical protein